MSTHKLVCDVCDRDLARSIAGALQELIQPAPHALTLFEQPAGNATAAGWRIEAYYEPMPDVDALSAELGTVLGAPAPDLSILAVEQQNWVAISQAALPPVAAGRFTVHGSHDAGRVARGPNAILIDAGEAFGTAHHATTYGCLAAIDALTRHRRFRRVLDLGCGSGVLAIAAARALPHARIIATDLDRQSVVVARANMRLNGVAHRIDARVADGLRTPELRHPARFDLVIANILADPLIALANGLARIMQPKANLVLSGLLVPQAPAVIAAYVAAGFRLDAHRRIHGWSTLTLARR